MSSKIILLFEGNNMKLKFDTINKKLIFIDNKGYSYNIGFEEKNIVVNNNCIKIDQKVKNQINRVSNILDQIQNNTQTRQALEPEPEV